MGLCKVSSLGKVLYCLCCKRAIYLKRSRAFAQDKAQQYGLTGFVKNTSDGKVGEESSDVSYGTGKQLADHSQVAGEAQGDESSLQKFVKDIKEGPKHAHVVKVEKTLMDPKEGESSFETG
jgi:acylphosphatase